MQLTEQQQQTILQAARSSIVAELRGQAGYQLPADPDPVLMQAAGCFVTLHELGTHRLRGCIGRLQSELPLLQSVHEMAHSAVHDPRFVNNPVTLALLGQLDLEVSVLSPLVAAATPLDFDPPNEGIYLFCSGRNGTFLPQVARETGWDRQQLLTRLCSEKMGLDGQAWKDPGARLFKYTVLVIGPVPFGQVPPTDAGGIGGLGGMGGLGGGNVFRI